MAELRIPLWLKTLCILQMMHLFPLFISAQTKGNASFIINGTHSAADSVLMEKSTAAMRTVKDSAELTRKLKELIQSKRAEGYGLFSIDSVHSENNHYTVYLFVGPIFKWAQLFCDSIDPVFLKGTGMRQKGLNNKPLDISALKTVQFKILRNAENNGYPFANLQMKNIMWEDERLTARLILDRNKLIRIDSIIIKGNATIAPIYIYNYIGISPGDIYSESRIQRISNRLKELAFVKEIRSSQVSFSEKLNRLYLFMENKKASQLDGVIGFLPDETQPGKLNLTGEVHLKLQNSFRRGEIIELHWKQLPPRSQDLKVHFLYPFLFNSPFGIDANLNIFKRDTVFIDVIKNLGIHYSLYGNNFVKAFVTDKESNLQSTKGLENITVLPSYADVSNTSYGATIHLERLDYRLNPSRGYSVEFTGSAGNRTITKNSEINPAVYDNLQLKSSTYHLSFTSDYYFSLAPKNVLNLGFVAARLVNPELFTNELFRIGGLRSLRGFDEESIFASTFAIGKLEYRYQIEQNSFLFLFYNQSWYERKRKDSYLRDTPLGFGAGINFETRLGIMSISYALGKQGDNPVYFRNGKVHFGIVNYF